MPALFFAVALAGACNQPLEKVMVGGGRKLTGTAGAGVMPTGGGGTSLSPTGGGGESGFANGAATGAGASAQDSGDAGSDKMVPPDYSKVDGGYATCQAFVLQYDVAIAEAQSCDLAGATGCQQVVFTHLGVCDFCPTYVNDATKPRAIEAQWQQAGCDQASPVQSCSHVCQTPTNYACVDTGNGTGTCGTGSGPSPCGSLETQYLAALASAKACTAGATGQCTQAVPSDLSPCSRQCATYVNDASTLNLIKTAWDSQGCGSLSVICSTAGACSSELSGACVTGDAGGASCVGNFSMSRDTL